MLSQAKAAAEAIPLEETAAALQSFGIPPAQHLAHNIQARGALSYFEPERKPHRAFVGAEHPLPVHSGVQTADQQPQLDLPFQPIPPSQFYNTTPCKTHQQSPKQANTVIQQVKHPRNQSLSDTTPKKTKRACSRPAAAAVQSGKITTNLQNSKAGAADTGYYTDEEITDLLQTVLGVDSELNFKALLQNSKKLWKLVCRLYFTSTLYLLIF
jgi:hypothetical protein